MKDRREWIKVTTEFPRHPKTMLLSDAAFRALITFWCYAFEYKTDGFLNKNFAKSVAKPRIISELKTVGFLSDSEGEPGFVLHDFTKHQATADEALKEHNSKSNAGSYGNHVRHHEKKNVVQMDCGYCRKGLAGASISRSQIVAE